MSEEPKDTKGTIDWQKYAHPTKGKSQTAVVDSEEDPPMGFHSGGGTRSVDYGKVSPTLKAGGMVAVDMGGGKGQANVTIDRSPPLTTSANGHAFFDGYNQAVQGKPCLKAGKDGGDSVVEMDLEATGAPEPGQLSLGLTSSAEVSRARTSPWLESVRDWLARGADFGTSSIVSLLRCVPGGASSKTCPAFFPATRDGTLPSSFEAWSSWGIASSGGSLTLSTSESPRGAAASSLSDVLESRVDSRYYLSPTACRGIIRRASRRGKELPARLLEALTRRASGSTRTSPEA